MRVLYDNLIESAIDLAMTNLDNDSYAEYLYDPYLELACICTASSSVITGSWADPVAVSAMAIGYHNADFARLILKDINDNELYNELISLEEDDSIYYITRVQGVYSFEVQLSGGEPIYIGFLSFGEYVEFPRFSVAPSMPVNIRSLSSKSLGGQISGVMARNIRGYEINIPVLTSAELDLMLEYLTAVQTCKPHMIDLYHLAHDKQAPFYGHVAQSLEVDKRVDGSFRFEVSLKYEEAR
jgi:hypothetical protein